MEYQTLYESWKREKETMELQPLGKGFYAETSAYIRAKREEIQMFDEHSLRSRLIKDEMNRVQRIISDIVELRFRKALEMVMLGMPPSTDLLASEEESLMNGLSTSKNQADILLQNVLIGQLPQTTLKRTTKKKTVIVRFLQDLQAIVGPNAQVYGPFKVEDIVALPVENAESLFKRGVAVKVETE